MAFKDEMKQKYEALSPEKKRVALIGGMAAVVIGLGMFFDKGTTPQKTAKNEPAKDMTVVAPMVRNTSAEAISAEVDMLSRKLGETEQVTTRMAKDSEESKRVSTELAAKHEELSRLNKDFEIMRQEMVLMKSGDGVQGPALNTQIQLPPISNQSQLPPLPSGGVGGDVAAAALPIEPPKPSRPAMRIIGNGSSGSGSGSGQVGIGMSDANNGLANVSGAINNDVRPQGSMATITAGDGAVSSQKVAEQQGTFIPAGSIIEGVLLSGMDAPTSGVAQKNPVPALMRVSKEAVLPNRYRENVRECFIILAGEGELSSERAKMRSESISCVRKDGGIIEAALDGYVTGEDGKVGMRGRLVSKQGSVLAKTFAAGLAGGIAKVLTPQSVPQLSIGQTGSVQTQQADLGTAGEAGLYQGMSSSANQLAKFYLDLASQMFPVIEIDAGRKATLILVRGTFLSLKPRESN